MYDAPKIYIWSLVIYFIFLDDFILHRSEPDFFYFFLSCRLSLLFLQKKFTREETISKLHYIMHAPYNYVWLLFLVCPQKMVEKEGKRLYNQHPHHGKILRIPSFPIFSRRIPIIIIISFWLTLFYFSCVYKKKYINDKRP